MTTACPPPPSPPLPPCVNLRGSRPPPCPGHAAIPYTDMSPPPVQETSPPPEALHPAEDPPAPPLLPVQETDPAPQTLTGPQMTEQQEDAAVQVDQAGEDQLP